MKKNVFITLCAVAAMASVSCARLEVNQEVPGLRVPAVINATAGVSTRATIDGLQISWVAGDQISLFDATGKAEGAFTADASGTSVSFSGTKEEGDVLKYAIYPANENATCTAGVFTTTIPGEQDGTISNAIAVAEEASGSFVFLNAASVIKITIPASETDINFVSFLADNAATIAGDVTVSMSDLTAVASPATNAKKYSRVSAYKGGQALSGDIYLTVIPGTYSGMVVFGKKDGTVRYAATVKVASKNYVVNRIKNFGTVANLTWVKGAVPGVFTMDADGHRALMSQGFIRYDDATKTWSIADTFTRLTSFNASGVIEVFKWNNAETPTAATDHGTDDWRDEGDWAKKLGQFGYQSGWKIGTVGEYEYCLRQTSKTTDSRETANLVRQCLGLVKVADGEYYAILYPDGWVGVSASYTAENEVPGVTMTIDELKALEDKGCAIFGHGGYLNKGTTIAWKAGTQMNLWTTERTGTKVANAFRFVYTGGKWTRLYKGLETSYGYCARPFFLVD
jgi:hypothetical protein